jgi:hypothetical protein
MQNTRKPQNEQTIISSLSRFGSKRESKTKSPKITRKGSAKSPKPRDSRISASSVQLCSSTFYDGMNCMDDTNRINSNSVFFTRYIYMHYRYMNYHTLGCMYYLQYERLCCISDSEKIKLKLYVN